LKRRVCLGVTLLLVGLLIVGCLGVGKKYSVPEQLWTAMAMALRALSCSSRKAAKALEA